MKIIVAYSGGLDTSVILTWLKEQYQCEIIAFCADIGQEEALKGLDKKALKTAASKSYILELSVSPEDAPNKPEYATLDFVKGNCVAVNGNRLSPANVMRALNKLGGKHGIGRVDLVENRFVGMKSRGVYETPGGSILHFAHRQVETLTMEREVMHLRDSLIPRYAELVYYGFWFSPERFA